IAIVELEAEFADLIPDLLLLRAQCEIHRPISYCRWLSACAKRGDTTASIAAAMASKRRSAPCSPISMRPTGASPARWHGIETEQRLRKFAIDGLRRTRKLAMR